MKRLTMLGLSLFPFGWAAEAQSVQMRSGLAIELLIMLGSFFILAAAVGVLRFPDVYTRLHASTKLVTLGGLGIFIGAAFAVGPVQATERVLLIAAFFFLTAPLSAYMITRSGYLRGFKPYTEPGSVDEWGACGAAVERLSDEARPEGAPE